MNQAIIAGCINSEGALMTLLAGTVVQVITVSTAITAVIVLCVAKHAPVARWICRNAWKLAVPLSLAIAVAAVVESDGVASALSMDTSSASLLIIVPPLLCGVCYGVSIRVLERY